MTQLASVATLAAALALSPAQAPAPSTHDHHAAVDARGARVMGFDQQRTVHHFRLHPDGGAIEVAVKEPSDTANRDAIRAHLPHVAALFAAGDFRAPMLVHAVEVPGTADLARLKSAVAWRYVETPLGGRVDIVTADAAALDAVHRFLRFQIADHRTGDAGTVVPRR
jgi:hypothetical protein